MYPAGRSVVGGRLIAVPGVATAKKYLAELHAGATAPGRDRRIIAGGPATARDGLRAVAAEYDADELLVVNILHDHDARRRSYGLLAEISAGRPPAIAKAKQGACAT